MNVMARLSTWLTTAKKMAARTTMIATMTEVIQVSCRLVQWILRPSARTSRKNFGVLASAWKKPGPFCGAAATADGVAMTDAVLAARSRIACGFFPGFLAMRRFKLSSGAAGHSALRVYIGWQEWRDSNPRLSVLETDALPAELHS